MSTDPTLRELELLEHIERNPDITQASLAVQLGVAVGTINWHLKRLVSKGYVKVKRAQRRKLRYIITPDGLAFRAHLTVDYINTSMRLYRRVRQRIGALLLDVKESNFDEVRISEGERDIVDICRLSCLEQNIAVVEEARKDVPLLSINGTQVTLVWPHETGELHE